MASGEPDPVGALMASLQANLSPRNNNANFNPVCNNQNLRQTVEVVKF